MFQVSRAFPVPREHQVYPDRLDGRETLATQALLDFKVHLDFRDLLEVQAWRDLRAFSAAQEYQVGLFLYY